MKKILTLGSLALFGLSGCFTENSASEQLSGTTISGVAALTYAEAGEEVVVEDATGEVLGEAVTDSNGEFTVETDLEDAEYPLLLKVRTREGKEYKSMLHPEEGKKKKQMRAHINAITDQVVKQLMERKQLSEVAQGEFEELGEQFVDDELNEELDFKSFHSEEGVKAPKKEKLGHGKGIGAIVMRALAEYAESQGATPAEILDQFADNPEQLGQDVAFIAKAMLATAKEGLDSLKGDQILEKLIKSPEQEGKAKRLRKMLREGAPEDFGKMNEWQHRYEKQRLEGMGERIHDGEKLIAPEDLERVCEGGDVVREQLKALHDEYLPKMEAATSEEERLQLRQELAEKEKALLDELHQKTDPAELES